MPLIAFMTLSEVKQRIILSLFDSPITFEELIEKTGAAPGNLLKEIKELLKEDAITKKDYPTVYALKPAFWAQAWQVKKEREKELKRTDLNCLLEDPCMV